MKLILNADDFGYSRALNYGIIDAYKFGAVRSATLMAGMPGAEHAAALAAENPGLGVGLHLNLTCGNPVSGPYKTITGKNGAFISQAELRENVDKLDLLEVWHEWEAQLERARSLGIIPDHLDSHHHAHLVDGLFETAMRFAEKYSLPMRLPGDFSAGFFGGNATESNLEKIIHENLQKEFFEIMCHPAHIDAPLLEGSSYNLQRTGELRILTSPELMDFIAQQNITLSNFREIKRK